MPGNKKYSVVWNNYIKTTGGGICKLCGKEIKSCGNTTNLMNHLQRKHDFVSNQANRKKNHIQTRDQTQRRPDKGILQLQFHIPVKMVTKVGASM
jgi:hypothetical protein